MSELRIGIIGLDTSHVAAFTGVFNVPEDPFFILGAGRIVQAFPGGSRGFHASWSRVEQFTDLARERGVQIMESIDAMAGLDAFLLNSCDGRQHLEQFRQLAPWGKPVFIDKPFACSYREAKEIVSLAERHGCPLMTSSSIRYAAGVSGLVPGAEICSAEAFGPLPLEADYPDYFWYGIHTAELLFSYMGTGCESVRAIHSEDFDLLFGLWKDGRQGLIHGNRVGASNFGIRLTTPEGHVTGLQDRSISHIFSLSRHLVTFLKDGKSEIPLTESLEIMAFLEAAGRSLHEGGRTVALTEVTGI